MTVVRDLRVYDHKRSEIAIRIDARRQLYGWLDTDKMTMSHKVTFHCCGHRLEYPLSAPLFASIFSDDVVVSNDAKTKVAHIIIQFAIRAESAARGGYDG